MRDAGLAQVGAFGRLPRTLGNPAWAAMVYAQVGMADSMFSRLTVAIERRDDVFGHLITMPMFAKYQSDPRWDAIGARNLPFTRVDFKPDATIRSVNIDDEGAARQVAEHLIALGHRHFGIVITQGAPLSTGAEAQQSAVYFVDKARLAGWRAAIEAAGIEWDTVPVAGAVDHGRAVGHAAGARLLDRAERPTAILALSDLLALGVIDAAAERGISVPTELSVAGFDDIPEARAATPGLTTVRQPHHRKGAEAVRLLLGDDPAQNVLLPTELVVRASTGPAPRKESSP